jgi:hypothetical protein
MHGPTAAAAAAGNQAAVAIRAALARPAPLEEGRESRAQKAAEFRQAPATNPVRVAPSPEGVGEAVNTVA